MTRAGQNRQSDGSDGDPPSCVLTAPSSVLANGAAKMKIPILAFWAASLACAFADGEQGPDIEQIMSRLGRNQAKAQDLRKDFTYHQKQLLRMNRGNHKLSREERREYDVTPDV